MLFEQGKLEKMVICVLDTEGDRPEVVQEKTFTVQVNPASYSLNKNTSVQNQTPQGNKDNTLTYVGTGPFNLQFEIVFDGTGVIQTSSGLDSVPLVGAIASALANDNKKEMTVDEQISAFEKIAYDPESSIHSPNSVKIFWGKLDFEGVLTAVSYSYTLFEADGSPLRAKANCTFQGSKIAKQSALESNNQSSDLTHQWEFKAGDALPLIAQKIYGNSELYLEVARVNNLINFRRLSAGMKLALPPTEKGGQA